MPIELIVSAYDERLGREAFDVARAACRLEVSDEWRAGDVAADGRVTLWSGFAARVGRERLPDLRAGCTAAVTRLRELRVEVAALHAAGAVWRLTLALRLDGGRPPGWHYASPPRFPGAVTDLGAELGVCVSVCAANGEWIAHWLAPAPRTGG